MLALLQGRQAWSTAPPEPSSREQNWPTLLFSWWCTSFAAVIILVRLNGRMIRSNVMFREDWIILAALIPLFIRMIFVHFILIYGTNNVQTVGQTFTDQQLHQKSIGARLVLLARIFYAMFIWTSKWAVSEFLKRITLHLWRRSYELTLQAIRIFLLVTFVAVVIATLAECQPFDHYWQVVPDPGPQCRQGFAQLITMGTADIITDILLVAFPIPIVLRSGQHWTRKLLLTLLFSSSISLIIVTAFRVPEVIEKQGRQQYRTVWASCEILASTFVSNFIIIGSFLRDKGSKRLKYKANSFSDSIERASTRRPTLVALSTAGSDENLFRSLGCRMPSHLLDPDDDFVPRPAPIALTPLNTSFSGVHADNTTSPEAIEDYEDSDDSMRKPPLTTDIPSPAPSSLTKKNVSFFDVGGLLEDNFEHSPETRSQSSTAFAPSEASHPIALDFAPPSVAGTRRGSRALLSDLGGLLTSRGENGGGPRSGFIRRPSHPNSPPQNPTRYTSPPTGILGPVLTRHDTDVSLQDPGGLLASSPVDSPHRRRFSPQSLQDAGGLMSDNHEVDANAAAALQRRVHAIHQQHPTPPPPRNTSGRHTAQGPDDMDIGDAGGLLG